MDERVSKEQAKVPVIGDLPGVGGLFRRDSRSRRKTDLVILLTPTIMTPARVTESAEQEQNRLSEANQPAGNR